MPETADTLLEVSDLKTYFYTDEGVGRAVDGVSFDLRRGETLGLVGESGCGKSVSALSIMRLVAEPPGRIESGRIVMNGQNLLDLSERQMCDIRGDDIAMIFQEPMTSLNPVLTCGYQIMEAVVLHQGVGKKEARLRAIDMLRLVGIPAPEQRIDDYPHQLSGGMRQRVMIAMALSCNPDLLIADEPTTALDVTIQAQILELLKRLQEELQMAILLITHDLGVIAETAARVAVMYAGKDCRTRRDRSPVQSSSPSVHPRAHGFDSTARYPDRSPGDHPRHGPRCNILPSRVPFQSALPPGRRQMSRRGAVAGVRYPRPSGELLEG